MDVLGPGTQGQGSTKQGGSDAGKSGLAPMAQLASSPQYKIKYSIFNFSIYYLSCTSRSRWGSPAHTAHSCLFPIRSRTSTHLYRNVGTKPKQQSMRPGRSRGETRVAPAGVCIPWLRAVCPAWKGVLYIIYAGLVLCESKSVVSTTVSSAKKVVGLPYFLRVLSTMDHSGTLGGSLRECSQ